MSTCEHPWCIETDPVEHAQWHSSDVVDFYSGERSGWWACLALENRSHCEVMVNIESEVDGRAGESVTIAAADLAFVLAAANTPEGRAVLDELLAKVTGG